MVISHIWGLFRDPVKEWAVIRDQDYSVAAIYGSHTFLLAAIPAVASYIGTTRIGWQIGMGDVHKLTTDSALLMAFAYYIAMLVGVYVVGYSIRWMGSTYCEEVPSINRSVALSAYTATPLFLIGITQLFPIIWMNLLLGLPALAYTIYLFYAGVPVMMNANKERAFLFSTAVMGFGLIALVALLAITVLIWGMGFGPQTIG